MNTIYNAVGEREELITKIEGLAKLYLSTKGNKEKRAIYSRLFALRVELSKFREEEQLNAIQFLGANYKNNNTFLN